MALTTCPECGKSNVSDSAVSCPECGYSIKEHFDKLKNESGVNQIPSETKSESKNQIFYTIMNKVQQSIIPKLNDFTKSKKGKVIIAILIVAILASVMGIYNTNKLSNEEKWALHNVEEYQNMLKDPNSMVLRGDILILWYHDEKSEQERIKEYTYFVASGDNSFGASIQSMPCFKGYIYLADLDSYKEDNFDTTEDYIEVLKADYAFNRYKAVGVSEDGNTAVFRAEIISGKKIAKKLHIEYNESN